jgi:tetratricopeptide (TPR) repeat protein
MPKLKQRRISQRPMTGGLGHNAEHVTHSSAAAVVCLAAILLAGGCTSLYRKPVADNVVSARQLSLRGIDAMQHEQWDEAEKLFQRAIETCPADERAHCRYAETLWRRGSAGEAIAHMEKAVQLSGGDPQLLVQVGEMYLAGGQLDKAAQRAERAIRANQQLASAWALQGSVLHQRGHADEALACFHRALSFQPYYPQVQVSVAEIYRQAGRPQRALATLDALADQFAPGEQPQQVAFLQGLALKALGRYDDAVESLTAASQRGPSSADLLYHLSEAQLLAGDPVNARLAVLQALDRDPKHQASQQLKAHIESRQQRMAAAIQR